MRMGLPTVPGASTAQLPSIGSVPSQISPKEVTGIPSEQIPASGLPTIGNLTPQLPPEIPFFPGFPGMVSEGLPEIGDITAAPQTPGFPSGSFSAGLSTPGFPQQDLSSNMETALGVPRIPSSSTPLNLTETRQMSLPGFAAGQVPSGTRALSVGLSSNSDTTPGLTGISVLPSAVPPVPSLPQIPGSFPTRITPPRLGAGIGLPSPPTQSSQSGIAGFGLNPDQLPIGTQDSSFGESTGSMPQIPGLGARVPLAVPQVNSGMLPAVSSQVLRMPTDITSAARMVPPSTSIRFPGRTMITGSQVNFGMVPQDGLLTSSTATPTGAQRLGDTMIPTNPYAGSVNEITATKLQEMGFPPNMPNADLLVRIDLYKSTL